MKSKQIAQVTPYLFDQNLIISLDQNWIKVFGKIPTFSVSIDKEGHLILSSKEQVEVKLGGHQIA